MTVNKLFVLMTLTGGVFLSGCSTYFRVVSDPEPGSDPNLKSPAGTFYLAELRLNSNGTDPRTAVKDKEFQVRYLPMLRKEYCKRYPALFSETATGSIPLLVESEAIKFSISNMKAQGFMHSYDSEEESFVRVSVWTGRKDLRSEAVEAKMRREEHARQWTNLFVIFNVQALEDAELQKRAPQMVTIIAKLIATKDPAFWTAQPRASASPTLLPTSPVATPAIPIPSETVAPF